MRDNPRLRQFKRPGGWLRHFAHHSESGSGDPVAIAWSLSVLQMPELQPEANVNRIP